MSLHKCLSALACLIPWLALAQPPVTIRVNANDALAPVPSSWAYFGYDEANYTYSPNGRKLIHELAALSPHPVQIRTHFLLTTGNGEAALKFGSTNAYTEDASGQPAYNWTVTDKILSTYIDAGATPFIEIGFMPEALSTHSEPYTPTWVPGAKNDQYYIGWTYPPKDYQKWAELIYQWVRHSIDKFGKEEVSKWQWEVWNEPNIGYWHGTPEEYDKLYDYTASAVKRALPGAQVGGPASTGPGGATAAAFLRQFLEHCAHGTNAVTGRPGAPLEFISFHAKGRPQLVNGRNIMGLSSEIKDAANGFDIVKSFPQFAHLPIVLTEADPEGCAACSARVYPQNAYRNGTLYPAYEAAAYKTLLDFAKKTDVNLQGVLTWAFEFEDQPYFDGFRSLATNGVDKPVLNFFRMLGLMTGIEVPAESTSARPPEAILSHGVPGPEPDVDAIAAKSDHNITVLVWNYRDEEQSNTAADIELHITGIPSNVDRVLVRHYRIDQDHSNAYTLWKQIGSPQKPTPEQYRQLEAAGQLQLLASPQWIDSASVEPMRFVLPTEALSLVEIGW